MSAFRGATVITFFPPDKGAVPWAGEGGWVYKICEYPGYDICQLLEGKIPDGKNGFRDPLMKEQEIAIPARVALTHVQRIGVVVQKRRTLAVEWPE